MRLQKASLLVVGGLIVLLAGCNNGGSTATPASESASPTDSSSASADSSTDPGTDSGSTATTVVVPTTVAQAPATVTQAPVTTTVTQGPNRDGSDNRHNGNGQEFGNTNGNRNGTGNGGLRAMNSNEKQMFQRCQRDTRQPGCDQYTSASLRKKGIDPNS